MSGVNCITCVNPCLQCSGNVNYCTQCKDVQHYINTGSCINKLVILLDLICHQQLLNHIRNGKGNLSQNYKKIILLYLRLLFTNQILNGCFYNICNPGWVNDNNYDCIACQNPCVTCSVNDTHCESCMDPNHEINATFQCICKDTYYPDTPDTCTACTIPCANCNALGCLTCIDSINKTELMIHNQIVNLSQICICKPGYYEVGVNCSQCALPCQTCEINQDHCLTCVDVNQTEINNQCICNDGYFEVSNYCQQCYNTIQLIFNYNFHVQNVKFQIIIVLNVQIPIMI